MNTTRKIQTAAGVVAMVALGACGGGGGGDDSGGGASNTPATIPASALASSSDFTDYVATLAANTSETDDPVVLGDIVAPTSDSDAPK